MKIKHLRQLIENCDPEDTVLVRIDGSIVPTEGFDEHEDYNDPPMPGEFFILTDNE
jgi:hypothetical protein